MPTSRQQLPDSVDAVTRTTQVIVCALAMGLLTFSGFAIFKRMDQQPEDGIFLIIGVVFAAMAIVMRFVVPPLIVSAQRKQIAGMLPDVSREPFAEDQQQADSEAFRQLYGLFQLKTIIAAAILEGAGFMNLIAYMNEGQMTSLIVAFVVMALVLMLFPTRSGVENWIEGEIATIEQVRHF